MLKECSRDSKDLLEREWSPSLNSVLEDALQRKVCLTMCCTCSSRTMQGYIMAIH